MATAVNPSTLAGISIGSSVSSVAEWLRRITVRVIGSGGSQGSGVVWHSDGLIMTNAHVAIAALHEVELPDGTRLEASLVARDPKIDLAALAVNAHNLATASVRSAQTVRAGEVIIAVGNPSDGIGAVSTGIVHHAVGNSRWLMADIRLAPGNSGGPLADAKGNVLGINSMVVGGFGCAVTSDTVEEFLKNKVGLAEAV